MKKIPTWLWITLGILGIALTASGWVLYWTNPRIAQPVAAQAAPECPEPLPQTAPLVRQDEGSMTTFPLESGELLVAVYQASSPIAAGIALPSHGLISLAAFQPTSDTLYLMPGGTTLLSPDDFQ